MEQKMDPKKPNTAMNAIVDVVSCIVVEGDEAAGAVPFSVLEGAAVGAAVGAGVGAG